MLHVRITGLLEREGDIDFFVCCFNRYFFYLLTCRQEKKRDPSRNMGCIYCYRLFFDIFLISFFAMCLLFSRSFNFNCVKAAVATCFLPWAIHVIWEKYMVNKVGFT